MLISKTHWQLPIAISLLFIIFWIPTYNVHGAVLRYIGDTYSCDEAGLNTAIADSQDGDTIGFISTCITIDVVAPIVVSKDLEFFGNGVITLRGGDTTHVFEFTSSSDSILRDLAIHDGYKQTDGGFGGALLNSGQLEIVHVNFGGGFATWGGAVYNEGTLTITNSQFNGNYATGSGGAIYNTGTLVVANTIISGNWSAGYAGGISNSGDLTLINTTISGNGAGIDGGGFTSGGDTLTMNNTIVYGNNADGAANDILVPSGTATVNHSLYGVATITLTGTNNITSPSQTPANFFTDYQVATPGNPIAGGDFSLQENADAINAGHKSYIANEANLNLNYYPDSDLDDSIPDYSGNNRIRGISVDMGAYEFASALILDMNDDNLISSTDVIYVINRQWQNPQLDATVKADVNRDNAINSADIYILLNLLGTTP